MPTQCLANSDTGHYNTNPKFGQSDAEQLDPAPTWFANKLLASKPFCWLLKDTQILVVTRPGLVYVDSINGHSRRAREVLEAHVVPVYVMEEASAAKKVKATERANDTGNKRWPSWKTRARAPTRIGCRRRVSSSVVTSSALR
ncbi:hypothetical protein BDV12DRAFT_192069 [Aspergillus spectabilis]